MSGLKRFLTGLFLGANLFTILMLWLCCLSTWISPEFHSLLSIIGLAFPVILLVNILFCLFWLIFKIRLIWVSLIGILAVSSYIYDFIPFNMSSEHPQDALKVISFNVGGMKEEDQRLELIAFVKEMGADIFCMQEVHGVWTERADVKTMMDSMQYRCLKGNGECIITRLPVVGDTIHITYPTRKNNSSLGCRLIYQNDTILVINNHLESNALSDDDKSEYKEMIKDPHKENVKKGGRNLAGKLGEAAAYRGPQADTLAALVKANGDRNIVLCGDFNDTPISYTYQRLARRMKSAFRDSGRGLGISYNQKGFPVRIDHIFMTKEWRSSQTHIVNRLDISDHYPIVTYLHKKRQ